MTGPLKKRLGLDFVDLLIHIGVTACALGFIGITNGPEPLFPVVTGASILALGVRRKVARRQMLDSPPEGERLAEVEERLAYLEALQDRVMELEERLDFTERVLAQRADSIAQLPDRK
jgi:hypothetical protein